MKKRRRTKDRSRPQLPREEIDLPLLDKYPPPTPEKIREIFGDPLPELTEAQRAAMRNKVIPGDQFVKWMKKEDRRLAKEERQRAKERDEIERWAKRTRREKFDPSKYVQKGLLDHDNNDISSR